jgi:hypothetical protein
MKKITPIQEVLESKKLKLLEKNTSLPYIFDLHWDAKIGKDLVELNDNKDVCRFLAEHGFNVKIWLKEVENW